MADGFVHLHCHSEYSMLDGAAKIGAMTQAAAEYGMPAIAVTDHGNTFAAFEFYNAARNAGVKPIVAFLSLPFYILTLGLFTLVVNALAHKFNPKIIGVLNRVCGGIIVLYGIKLLVDFAMAVL